MMRCSRPATPSTRHPATSRCSTSPAPNSCGSAPAKSCARPRRSCRRTCRRCRTAQRRRRGGAQPPPSAAAWRPNLSAYGECLAGCRLLIRLTRWPPALDVSTRDEPVYLSGSRPETHQHWWPAGANCCQSLLLDPDATIGIDLRKWLFLLVSGRGESPRVFPYHGCALPTCLYPKDALGMPQCSDGAVWDGQ